MYPKLIMNSVPKEKKNLYLRFTSRSYITSLLVIPDISRTETRTSILILCSKKLQRQPNIYKYAFKRKRIVLPRQSIASNYAPPLRYMKYGHTIFARDPLLSPLPDK